LAAVLAFWVADKLGTSPQPVLAPLTALLVAQLMTYQTVASGLERVASVLAGVLLAVGAASLVGLTWWSLGAGRRAVPGAGAAAPARVEPAGGPDQRDDRAGRRGAT